MCVIVSAFLNNTNIYRAIQLLGRLWWQLRDFMVCHAVLLCGLSSFICFVRKTDESKMATIAVGGVFSVFAAVARFVIAFVTAKILGNPVGAGFFYGNNIIFNVLATILIFMFFLTIKIESQRACKAINAIAKSSFAVYLIHENPFVRPYLEELIPRLYDFHSVWLPAQFFAIVLMIWGTCTLVDYIRQFIFIPLGKRNWLVSLDDKVNSL